jgi:hypothetical protein
MFYRLNGRQTCTSAITANTHNPAPATAHDAQYTPATASPDARASTCKALIWISFPRADAAMLWLLAC